MIKVQAQHGNGDVTTIPTWLWGSIGAVLLSASGAIGIWAGGMLIAHDRAIVSLDGRQTRTERDIDAIGIKLDRIWNKLDELR